MPDQVLSYVNEDGDRMGLGLLPRELACGEIPGVLKWDGAEDACPLVPRVEWREQSDLRCYEKDDIFQNGYPACCLAGGANVVEFFLARAGRWVKLDWYRAWYDLSRGAGGVAIDAGVRYAMDKGFPIAGSGGKERIHVTEVWDCPSIEAAVSGLLRGGLLWFGWHFPGGPHCEAGTRYVKTIAGEFIDTRNSHGKSYGQEGWHLIPLANIAAGIKDFGAFIVREVEVRRNGIPDLKIGKGIGGKP